MSKDARTPENVSSGTSLSTALEFPCAGCGQVMAVPYLVPGERAKCRACGVKNVVPDDARLVEYVPHPPNDQGDADVVLPPNECPACGHPFTPMTHCVACGYQPGNIRLFNPKNFEYLAIIFTGLVPLWMASSNYKRLGQEDRRRRLLTMGSLVYGAVFAGLIAFTDVTLSSSAKHLIGFLAVELLNYPLGWYLKHQQLPIYARSRSLGSGTASMWKGVIGGCVLFVSIVVVAWALASPYLNRHINRGRHLMDKGDYAAAAIAFRHALAQDPKNTEALGKAGVCEAISGRYQASVSHLQRYLRREPRKAKVWLLLGAVHQELGNSVAGDSCRRIAEQLDSSLVQRR